MKPPLTNDQLIMMIDWLNGIKHEIKEVYIKSATGLMLELFMNRFQRSIEKLEVQDQYIKCEGINYKRLNFEIKNSFSSYSSWYTLDFLFSMDTKRIDIDCSKFLEEDINMFLRSWQEGKTNRNLNQMDMITVGERDMRKVLKDCEGVLMDPRTTKFEVFEQKNIYSSFFSPREPNKWIHGGIHIRRNDGRLAVIDNSKYWTVNEHVSEKQIEKYEITREIWNSEDDTWFESWFHIYFF
uniref:FBA_2 domain-containing protein n=1 Tax=Caenorhabditis tropicalis TaxID=1561998 RepID=A0A1I7U1B0_9PELO